MKPKRRNPVLHALGLSPELLTHRTNKPRPVGAVSASELERDVLAFIAERYADRHLDVETAQLGLANAAQRLIVARLRVVAGRAEGPLLVHAG
jgi:hypothetical protein